MSNDQDRTQNVKENNQQSAKNVRLSSCRESNLYLFYSNKNMDMWSSIQAVAQ